MNIINNEKVDIFYDLIDEACMLLNQNLGILYIDALFRVGNDLIFEVDDSKLDKETLEKLESIYEILNKQTFYNEEIRLALELLIVKALKHASLPLNTMTPDAISYLLSIIIKDKFFKNKNKVNNFTIIDTVLGTSNMLQAISNNIDAKLNLVGIENVDYLCKISEISSNLQANEIKIYYQDALKEIYDSADLVIGDLDSINYENETYNSFLYDKGVRYFPYLLIEKRIKNIKEQGYFMFVIDNDFFSRQEAEIFKEYLIDKATLMALIVLPPGVVQREHVGKSILIGKKEVLNDYHMVIFTLKNFEKEYLEEALKKLEQLVGEI